MKKCEKAPLTNSTNDQTQETGTWMLLNHRDVNKSMNVHCHTSLVLVSWLYILCFMYVNRCVLYDANKNIEFNYHYFNLLANHSSLGHWNVNTQWNLWLPNLKWANTCLDIYQTLSRTKNIKNSREKITWFYAHLTNQSTDLVSQHLKCWYSHS